MKDFVLFIPKFILFIPSKNYTKRAASLSDSYSRFFGMFTRNSLTGGTAENNMASNALQNLIAEHLHNSRQQ